MSEENLLGFKESCWGFLLVEQMVEHAVHDLFHVRFLHVQHQLSLTKEVLHIQMGTNFSSKVFHRNFLEYIEILQHTLRTGHDCEAWRLSGKFDALRLESRRPFKSHSSRHVGTLGKSFTCSRL